MYLFIIKIFFILISFNIQIEFMSFDLEMTGIKGDKESIDDTLDEKYVKV